MQTLIKYWYVLENFCHLEQAITYEQKLRIIVAHWKATTIILNLIFCRCKEKKTSISFSVSIYEVILLNYFTSFLLALVAVTVNPDKNY